jgi:hypothetical protein
MRAIVMGFILGALIGQVLIALQSIKHFVPEPKASDERANPVVEAMSYV